MASLKTRFYNKVEGRRPGVTLLRRWTLLEKGKEPMRFYSAETALRMLEVRQEHGGVGLRFGWNIEPSKVPARSCSPMPDMAELVENCGVKEACRIMEREVVVNG